MATLTAAMRSGNSGKTSTSSSPTTSPLSVSQSRKSARFTGSTRTTRVIAVVLSATFFWHDGNSIKLETASRQVNLEGFVFIMGIQHSFWPPLR
jgi:hypothetical protein